MRDLLFVEESHQYFLMNEEGVAEVELPALTNILKAVGIIDTRWFTDAGRARGKAVHRVLELIDKNDLDWGSVDPRMYGYLEAYLKFKEDYKPEYTAIEEPTYHKTKLYGCTEDRVCADGTVIDIKTGAEARWHSCQLTGCAVALESQGLDIEPEYEAWDAILQTYRWTKEGRAK